MKKGKPDKPPGKPQNPPQEPPVSEDSKTISFTTDGPSTITITVAVSGASIEQPPPDIEEPPPDIEEPPPDIEQPPPITDGNELEVGSGKPYATVVDAYNAAQPGDTITVDDGLYANPFIQEKEGLTIRSRSGNPYACVFDGQGGEGHGHPLAWHKGMILCRVSTNIEGIGFFGCGSPQSGDNYSNEAGIYVGDTDGQDVQVLVRRCAFDDNGNGVFGDGGRNNHVVIEECIYGYYKPNGRNASAGGGGHHPAHDNYIQGGSVDVSGSYFYGCCNGHNVKSRALKTTVHDNPLLTQDGGRVLDVSDGGEATLANNTIFTRTDRQEGAGWYGNANMVGYATESANNGTQGLQMSGNTMNVNRSGSKIWAGNGTTVTMSGDTVNCYDGGSVITEGNVTGLPQANNPGGSMPSRPNPPSWAAA